MPFDSVSWLLIIYHTGLH